jgi:hypothetical protein
MNAWVVSLIAFVCVLIGAAIGSALRVVLPEAHLREDTKDMVKVGVGLLVTLSALVMGLLIASVKDSFDTQSAEVRQAATRLILLDRTLRQYGPEADPIRATLRSEVATRTEIAWMKTGAQPPAPAGDVVSSVQMRLMALPATNDTQRHLRDNAVRLGEELMQMRWLLYEQSAGTIAVPFLVVLVFWLMVISASLNLFAPRHGTLAMVNIVCALSISSALFLIVEMDRPFDGLLRISDAPLRSAIEQMNR